MRSSEVEIETQTWQRFYSWTGLVYAIGDSAIDRRHCEWLAPRCAIGRGKFAHNRDRLFSLKGLG
ncbi:MAG: hypothetical protein GDA56_17600 [Hormoscilla sp. GM7CHS1pb]|nr:hypothetical protein [Hormoscilla sp. GM7CHS1pb]